MSATANAVPDHFLVFVPGILGSKLQDRQGKTIWLDFSSVPYNPLHWKGWAETTLQTLSYPNDDLVAKEILNEVVFVPPWVKQEHYGRLLKNLTALGYVLNPSAGSPRGPALYTFPYDWRQDNRKSAAQLRDQIDQWGKRHPGARPWLIAHSMGGMVSRWYIEKLGGKDEVDRLFLIASPWDGAPRALQVLFDGLAVFLRSSFNYFFDIRAATRAFLRSLPSMYQLLPYQNPFLHDQANQSIPLQNGAGWLDAERQSLLLDGLRFNQELGTTMSVPQTVCFFGRKTPTPSFGTLTTAAGGVWRAIAWGVTEAGDGTVPERSAVHPNAAAKIPIAASHGDIYVHETLREMLQWELSDKFLLPVRAAVSGEGLRVVFTLDRDTCPPGGPITLMATLKEDTPAGKAVTEAHITATTTFSQPLPGQEHEKDGAPPSASPPPVVLEESDDPGQYKGVLPAPIREGYYRVRAVIETRGPKPLVVDELIAVEALPAAASPEGPSTADKGP
jgi:pimeloyl-ACP methyl ester carboxylesterase